MSGRKKASRKLQGTSAGTARASSPGTARTSVAGTARTSPPGTRTASDGGKAIKSGGGDSNASGGAGQAGGERAKKPILEAVLGSTGQAAPIDTPPIPDPITSGEPIPDEKPDKQGRTGKAKGGRPPGSGSKQSKKEREAAEQAATESDEHRRATEMTEDIAGLAHIAFGFVATRAGEHWALEDDEAKRLAYRIARVDIKWKGLLDRYGEEAMLIGCIASLAWPRLKKDIVNARKRAREAAGGPVVDGIAAVVSEPGLEPAPEPESGEGPGIDTILGN